MLQDVFLLREGNRECIKSLISLENGIIRSCLQGHMGQIFADHPLHPGAVLLCNGDFALLGGDPTRPSSRHLAGKLALQRGKTWIVPYEPGWEEHIRYWKPMKMDKILRYKVTTPQAFDRDKLYTLKVAVPTRFALHKIDANLYEKALSQDWSHDFCSQFKSAEDYLNRGMGVAALYGGEIVAGASSYVVYDGGLEIQTDTREDMRRKGMASACCASLIIDCLDKNIIPSWDAANEASLALSQKLGYAFHTSYDAWEVAF